MPSVPGVPGVPSPEELSALPAGELAARLAEAYRIIGELTAQVGRLSAQVENLRRRAGRDRSLRERGGGRESSRAWASNAVTESPIVSASSVGGRVSLGRKARRVGS